MVCTAGVCAAAAVGGSGVCLQDPRGPMPSLDVPVVPTPAAVDRSRRRRMWLLWRHLPKGKGGKARAVIQSLKWWAGACHDRRGCRRGRLAIPSPCATALLPQPPACPSLGGAACRPSDCRGAGVGPAASLIGLLRLRAGMLQHAEREGGPARGAPTCVQPPQTSLAATGPTGRQGCLVSLGCVCVVTR
jgi:hypothetical protein